MNPLFQEDINDAFDDSLLETFVFIKFFFILIEMFSPVKHFCMVLINALLWSTYYLYYHRGYY